MVDVEQGGKRYAVSDREFQEYLSRICAGGDVSAAIDLQPLRAQYPEYFDLDASTGLDVYVWQMSPGSYYFGLLPHTASPRDSTAQELLSFAVQVVSKCGISLPRMRSIRMISTSFRGKILFPAISRSAGSSRKTEKVRRKTGAVHRNGQSHAFGRWRRADTRRLPDLRFHRFRCGRGRDR